MVSNRNWQCLLTEMMPSVRMQLKSPFRPYYNIHWYFLYNQFKWYAPIISTAFSMAKVPMNITLTRISHFYENQLLTIQFGFLSGQVWYICHQNSGSCIPLQWKIVHLLYWSHGIIWPHQQRLFSSIRYHLPSSDRETLSFNKIVRLARAPMPKHFKLHK